MRSIPFAGLKSNSVNLGQEFRSKGRRSLTFHPEYVRLNVKVARSVVVRERHKLATNAVAYRHVVRR